MSERSPEDFPKPTIDAGGNPQNVQPHLEGVPYKEMTLQEAIDEGIVVPTVDPETLQKVQQKTYWSDRPPAVEPSIDVQPAPKKWSLKKKVGAAAASALVLMGIGVGVSNTFANPGGLPQKPAATGPAAPNQGEQPLPNTTVPGANETITYVPVTQENIKDYEAVVEATKLQAGEYKTASAALPGFVEQFNGLINIHFTEEELESSKNFISKTGKVGPHALLEMKQSAYSDLFIGSGQFRDNLIKESNKNFDFWLETRKEETPFEAKFVLTDKGYFAYTSNVNHNSLPDVPDAKIFNIIGVPVLSNMTSADKDPTHRVWQFPSNAELVATGSTVPNQ
jgi:hypothetical protein